MKKLLLKLSLVVGSSLVAYNCSSEPKVLPDEMWEGLSNYSYQYLTAPQYEVSTIAFHSNKLLAEFDFKSLSLKELKVNDAPESAVEALSSRKPIATSDRDLMEIYLLYKGERYELNKGGSWSGKLTWTKLIDGGRYFQHRYLTKLEFEDGAPAMEANLHISMWSDAINFDLDVKELEELDDEWDIEMIVKCDDGLHYSSYNQLKRADDKVIITKSSPADAMFSHYQRLSCSISTEPTTAVEKLETTSLTAYDYRGQQVGEQIPVVYDSIYRCYRVELTDNIEKHHDLNRVKITLKNDAEVEQDIPIMFHLKDVHYITGISAFFRDMNQNPIGIPIQISKNWHTEKGKQFEYQGPWFHGLTSLRLPAESEVELEFTMAGAYWGRVPAASHAQLSLAGYYNDQNGGQLWEQSAIGAFGESICYEPEQGMGHSFVTDVRPLLVSDPYSNNRKWGWTTNVGGADFAKVSDGDDEVITLTNIKTQYKRYGPNMTEVIYSGELEGGYADVEINTSVSRSDDYVRGNYKVTFVVNKDFDFTQLAIFQLGAEGYSVPNSKKFAVGDENGMIESRDWTPGDESWEWREYKDRFNKYTYRSKPIDGVAWVSMHDAFTRLQKNQYTYSACRGIVVRDWNATIGGKSMSPCFVENSIMSRFGGATSVMELTLPEEVKSLKAGDSIEATFSMVIFPMTKGDTQYYGPNVAFRDALAEGANTWKMVLRDAQNIPEVKAVGGEVVSTNPITIVATSEDLTVDITGGLGFAPLVVKGVKSYDALNLNVTVNGKSIDLKDQENHGNDYWQCDYDVDSQSWDLIYNIPLDSEVHYLPIDK